MKYLPLNCSWSGWSVFDQISVRITWKTDTNLWRRVIAVSLDGTFTCSQSPLPDMVGLSRGRIVKIDSTAGLIHYAYVNAYCAAKHRVIGLTRSPARELATKGITVNAVCCGYSDTDMRGKRLPRLWRKPAEPSTKRLLN
jgi:3-hydroxybutyrate dehydrogenase